MLFSAFAGWEAMAHLVGEFRASRRDVRRATTATLIIVSVLYLAVAAAVNLLHGRRRVGTALTACALPFALTHVLVPVIVAALALICDLTIRRRRARWQRPVEHRPLPPQVIEKARSHPSDVVRSERRSDRCAGDPRDRVRPGNCASPGRSMPRWVLVGPLRPVSMLLMLRAVLVGIGDVRQLVTGTLTRTASWDLIL